MSAIVVTPANVGIAFPASAEVYPAVAAVALTAGQIVHWNSSGKLILSDADAAGTAKVAGVCLKTVGAGGTTDILVRGHLEGLTLTALAYGAKAYLSDTAGGFDTAAGTVSTVVGSVVPTSEPGAPKLLYFQANMLAL